MNAGVSDKLHVIVVASTYLPGEKAGGPVRSISNLVDRLGDVVDFFVVTRDRDIDGKESYPGIVAGRSSKVGNAEVFYCGSEGFGSLLRACREVDADLLYLNSYHGRFTRRMLVLRRLGALGTIPVLLAPRGEFSEGALRIKRLKSGSTEKRQRRWGSMTACDGM